MKKTNPNNKRKGLFGLFATLALALGVGVAIVPREVIRTQAAGTYSWTAASGIQTQFSGTSGTATLAGMGWSFTKSNSSASQFWSSPAVQIGANGSATSLTMSANLPASYGDEANRITVKTASYQGAHKLSISVGGTVLVEPTATSSWQTLGTISTGVIPEGVNGVIELKWTAGSRAMYIESIVIEGRDVSTTVVTELQVNPTSKSYLTNAVLQEADYAVSVTKDGSAGTNEDYSAKIGTGTGTSFSGVDIVWGTTKPKVSDQTIQFKAKYPQTSGGSDFLIAEVALTVTEPVFGTLSSIAIKTPASKISFLVGQTFSSNGLVLTASDNSSPVVTKDVTAGFTTNRDGLVFTAEHIGTLQVTVSYAEGDAPKTVVYSITVSEVPTVKTYEKISSADELYIGATYIISGVDESDTYAMSTTQGNNNRPAVLATLIGGNIEDSSTIQRFELVNGNKAGTYAFKTLNGSLVGQYIYADSSSSNYLKTNSALNDNASWAITFSDGELSAIAQGTNTRNRLKFNINSDNKAPLFSCYASTNTLPTISLYIDPTSLSTDPEVEIMVDKTQIVERDTLQLSALIKNASGAVVTWSVNDLTIATINSTTGLLTSLKPGSVIVTASMIFGGVTYEATKTITIVASPFAHDGTEADPFSVADALFKAQQTGTTQTSADFYVKGIISEVTEVDTGSFGNATFKIKDSLSDTVAFGAYRVKWGTNGVNFTTETAKNIVVGYEVLLVGKIVNYNNNTPQLIQNSKVLSVNKTAAIYAEAKVFADWIMAKDGGDAEGMTSPSTCEDNFLEAWLMWDDLSQDAKDLFKTHADFASAKARLTNWALANDVMSLDEMDNESSGTKESLHSNVNSITLTVLIGVVGLTALTGYYFLKRKKAETN